MNHKELLEAAKKGKEFSYAPYSGFHVGAALLCKSGRVYTGANVENTSSCLTCCAERVALFKAVTDGEKEFVAVAITSDSSDDVTTPCGPCRQALMEFSPEMDVIMSNSKLDYEVDKLINLLPRAIYK